jgi:hypothetical protein
MNRKLVALLAASALAITLAGCTGGSAKQNADAAPTALPTPVTAEATAEPAAEEGGFQPLAFGQTNEWEDGLAIAISEPAAYTPTEYAAGVDGPNAIYFTITLTNGTDEPVQPLVLTSLSSGGAEGGSIFDTGNDMPTEGAPATAVLPGKSVSWIEAYSVVDPADLTLQVTPGYAYDAAIFATK